MELENLSLFIWGVENRIEKNKKNTTRSYDLEILCKEPLLIQSLFF